MDFSNNDSFKKIRKIFYIVAIISMLLSIKNKVLGFSFNYENEDYSLIMPDWVEENDIHYYLAITQSKTNLSSYGLNILFYTENQLDLTTSGTNYVFDSSSSSGWLVTSVSNFSSFTNAINYYNNTLLPSISYQSYSTYKTRYSYLNNYIVDGNANYNLLCAFCDTNVYVDNNLKLESNITPPFNYPSFDNVTEIENGNPDGVFISAGDFTNTDNLYFHLLEINTGLANSDQSIYYYSDKTITLNKDSDYYRTWEDPSIQGFYYYIPRYKLGLSQNTSYLYVLNNSNKQIQNSQGIYQEDVSNGIYDVLESDTAGVISATEEQSDRMKNLEESLQNTDNTLNNINNSLTDTNVNDDTNANINSSLNFNNSAPQFSSLFNGYFSRLTSIISDLGNYQDTDVITISIPIPFTNDTIPISSNFIFSNQNNTFLKNLASTLWYFIFGRYFLYFLINIYWLITNGQFFDYYLTQKEAITGDML